MSKSFIYKGREVVRKLLCFSDKVTEYEIDKDAPILGINSNIDNDESLRLLNSEIKSNLIADLVKFWMASPDVKFRYMIISFQKFISANSSKFKDIDFRNAVINLFVALFQQILIEVNPLVMERKSLVTILRVNNISNSKSLVEAFKKFDIPYQKSVIAQDSMGFVNKAISDSSTEGYKNVIEELITLLTINLPKEN